MTRYEAAALLSACLDRVTEVTDELKRLLKEFETELAILKGRVDAWPRLANWKQPSSPLPPSSRAKPFGSLVQQKALAMKISLMITTLLPALFPSVTTYVLD